MEERMTNQLSGGQQQRVAGALVVSSVLLFDEPLSRALSAKLRVDMATRSVIFSGRLVLPPSIFT